MKKVHASSEPLLDLNEAEMAANSLDLEHIQAPVEFEHAAYTPMLHGPEIYDDEGTLICMFSRKPWHEVPIEWRRLCKENGAEWRQLFRTELANEMLALGSFCLPLQCILGSARK